MKFPRFVDKKIIFQQDFELKAFTILPGELEDKDKDKNKDKDKDKDNTITKTKVMLTILPGEFQMEAKKVAVSLCLPRRRPRDLEMKKYLIVKKKYLQHKNKGDGRFSLL